MHFDLLSQEGWKLTNPGGNDDGSGRAAYLTRKPTTTPPPLNANELSTGLKAVGDGVIALGVGGATAPKHILLVPLGTGFAGYFKFRVLGWRPTKLGAGLPLWVPVELVNVFCDLVQNAVPNSWGVTGSDLGPSQLFADDLGVTLTTGGPTGGPTWNVATMFPYVTDEFEMGTSFNDVGFLKMPTLGFPYLEVIFSFSVGVQQAATTANCLWCRG